MVERGLSVAAEWPEYGGESRIARSQIGSIEAEYAAFLYLAEYAVGSFGATERTIG